MPAKAKQPSTSDQSGLPRRRPATQDMKKNRAVIRRNTKKASRNPRVKHKKRYEKAVKRHLASRPGAKREHNRVVYEGEHTGINPNLIRSTSIKDTF